MQFSKLVQVARTRAMGLSFDRDARQEALLDSAAGAAPVRQLAIARHLSRLRNFRAASRIVKGLDSDRLSFLDQCFVGVTLLSAQDGLLSDQLLAPHVARLDERTLGPEDAVRLAEWIQLSGLSMHDKLRAFEDLQASLGGSRASATCWPSSMPATRTRTGGRTTCGTSAISSRTVTRRRRGPSWRGSCPSTACGIAAWSKRRSGSTPVR